MLGVLQMIPENGTGGVNVVRSSVVDTCRVNDGNARRTGGET